MNRILIETLQPPEKKIIKMCSPSAFVLRSLYCEERAYYRREVESREDQVEFSPPETLIHAS